MNKITVISTLAAYKEKDMKYKDKIKKVKELIPGIPKDEAEKIYMDAELYELENDYDIESAITMINNVNKMCDNFFNEDVDEFSKKKAEKDLKALLAAGMDDVF